MSLSPLARGIGAGACEEARYLGIGAGCLRTQLIVSVAASVPRTHYSRDEANAYVEEVLVTVDALLEALAKEVEYMRAQDAEDKAEFKEMWGHKAPPEKATKP